MFHSQNLIQEVGTVTWTLASGQLWPDELATDGSLALAFRVVAEKHFVSRNIGIATNNLFLIGPVKIEFQ